MTTDPEHVDSDAPQDDADLDAPVAELGDVSWPLGDRFAARVRGRIERRILAAESLELFWTAPLAMLIEFLRWPFDLFTGRRE